MRRLSTGYPICFCTGGAAGFDPEREIAPGDLRRLFEAAGWAASSYNEQPWRFL